MPDWSYRTILRPILCRVPAETARDFTLSTMGRLAALPLGSTVIHIMGYMKPPEDVGCSVLGLKLPGPVGLSAGLDPHFAAIKALSQFGFGFLEVGPVTKTSVNATEPIERLTDQQAIRYPADPVNDGVDALVARMEKIGKLPIPLGVRLPFSPESTADPCYVAERLSKFAAFFTIEAPSCLKPDNTDWDKCLSALLTTLHNAATPRPLLLCLPPDVDDRETEEFISSALSAGVQGILISDEKRDPAGRRVVGPPATADCLTLLQFLRTCFGDALPIIASGGISNPAEALTFLGAGATLIQIHSGLVYVGPGLPKRINEALAYYRPTKGTSTPAAERPGWIPRWAWIAILGVMLVASAMVAWEVAITSVVLPYDEAFLGISRAQMIAINDLLLPFMAHDRVTLVGTMIATGVLYVGLALFAIRHGMGWAREAFLASCLAGFLSFFLFLGFGYFDPLHAALTLMLVPLFVLGIRATSGSPRYPIPNLSDNRRWRIGQWAQLTFVTIGFGLIVAGLAIILVGIKNTFVPEDLQFMKTTAEALQAANARLLPLIAHDRVGFGGNLVANGLAVILISLWGFRQGARWLWWTLLFAGVPGFVAALGIHIVVAYENLWHLFPAILALVLYTLGIVLSWPYLWHPPEAYQAS